MGHLINPVSLRLSVNSFWNSNWVLVNNFNYINIFKKDYLLYSYLNFFLKNILLVKTNIIYSHYKIYRVNQSVYINLYSYNAELQSYNYSFFCKIYKYFLFKTYYSKNVYINLKKIIFKLESKSINLLVKKSKKNFSKFFIIIKRLYLYLMEKIVEYGFSFFVKTKLFYYLPRVEKFNKFFYVNIYCSTISNISVEAIAKYISLKLQMKYTIGWILRPIIKDFNVKLKNNFLLGYKILCSGRFTRKQIATYNWVKRGSIKANSILSLVKYSEVRVRLKYGLCGIKLWMNYGFNNIDLTKKSFFLTNINYLPFKYAFLTKNQKNYIIFYFNSWFFYFVRILFFKKGLFHLYKFFLRIRVKILMKNLFKLNNNFSNYKLVLLKNNKILIIFLKKRINYFSKLLWSQKKLQFL